MKIKVDGQAAMFNCPGCDKTHIVYIAPHPKPWGFNGDVERPTFTPSVLVYANESNPRCHSFVRDGKIEYLSDCEHDLAGTTVDLPEFDGVKI